MPLVVLIVLNSWLVFELCQMRKRRSSHIKDKNEANLGLVLVMIVVVFVLCQSPGLVAQLDEMFPSILPDDSPLERLFLAGSNLLFSLNSAVNFLIYTTFGKRFRRVLMTIVRGFFKSLLKGSRYSRSRQSNIGLNTMTCSREGDSEQTTLFTNANQID